jgi:hypothetical protein
VPSERCSTEEQSIDVIYLNNPICSNPLITLRVSCEGSVMNYKHRDTICRKMLDCLNE